ncbi:hypothetical protein DFH06DRAFT_1094356 [Mycena polygramma]|nr:hypothetical protein DFH06DRAFT_1094356 [Mycena polygramma]
MSMDGTLGALEIGSTGCTFLFGILTVQVYIYQRTYSADSRFIKALVGSVWILELGHTIGTNHAVYYMTIKAFGRPDLLVKLPNSLAVTLLFEGFMTFLVEGFFTYRVYRIYGTRYIAVFWFLAAMRLLASAAMCILCFIPPVPVPFSAFAAKYDWLLEIIQIIGALVDVGIAVALCIYYFRHKDTTFTSTNKLIDKLIAWAVSTGLTTSLISVLTLVFFLTMKNNLVWVSMYVLVGKVYSNSLLATLNARNGLREIGEYGVFIDGRSVLKKENARVSRLQFASRPQFAEQLNIETDTDILEDRSNAQKFPTLTPAV